MDGTIDVVILVQVSPWRIKLNGTDRVCVRIYTVVFLLKKGVKLLLILLPEWGQELLGFYLITLNREVIKPGDSLLAQRSFQSLGCLDLRPKLDVFVDKGTQVHPKRFTN